MLNDNLERWGVQELNAAEEVAVEGGHPLFWFFVGYAASKFIDGAIEHWNDDPGNTWWRDMP